MIVAAADSAHIDEPFAEIHPSDAQAFGIVDRGLVSVETEHGRAVVRASVTDGVQAGTIFAPIHWSDANSSAARVGALVHSAVDPISGQPDSKATPTRSRPVAAKVLGFLLSADDIQAEAKNELHYWATARVTNGYLTKFALQTSYEEALSISGGMLSTSERMTFSDDQAGVQRAAGLRDGRVESIVFLAPDVSLAPSAWLTSMVARDQLSAAERRGHLAGGLADCPDAGAIVCVCHQVGSKTIAGAIAGGCMSAAAVGNACSAGTNCGSCLPEINRMIATVKSGGPALA